MNKHNLFYLFRKPCYIIFQHRAKTFNPYAEYKKIKKIKGESDVKKGNILITPIVGAYGHYMEGLFARKAAINGYDVYSLCCGGFLDKCEGVQEITTRKNYRCAICAAEQEEFNKAYKLNPIYYNDILKELSNEDINKEEESFFNDTEAPHIYKGVSYDKILYTALQRYYLIADPVIEDNPITRGFLRNILCTLKILDIIVKKLSPKVVFSSHGTYASWGAVVEFCKAHDIYVVTFGQTYNKGSIAFTYRDSYLTGILNDKKNEWMKKELTEKDRELITRFFDERLGRISDENMAFNYNKNNKEHFSREQLCEELGISPNMKIVGLFPNIPWDGQVTGESAVFPRFRDWLKTTVDYFSQIENVVLIIRAHPAEVLTGLNAGRETITTMLEEMFEKLPKNIILLDPKHKINSFTLGENSDFGVAYSSTVCLELTYMKVPVIVCGCPAFLGKGVTFDIKSKENYLEMIKDGLEGKLKVGPDRIEKLYKFTHYFFYMRTMPQTLAKIKDFNVEKYLFENEEQLNSDPVFDEMFNCIENEKPMDFSRFFY